MAAPWTVPEWVRRTNGANTVTAWARRIATACPVRTPPRLPKLPRHCNYHATSRHCFRTASWLKKK